MDLAKNIITEMGLLPDFTVYGRVSAIVGQLVEVNGAEGNLSIGDRCRIIARGDHQVTCEVVGFRRGQALLMPFDSLDGIGLGCRAEVTATDPVTYPRRGWMGPRAPASA